MRPKPPADVAIGPPLVHALLAEQHPDLAHLALTELGNGWDNALFRLGDELIVRLPRRAASAVLIEHEQRWLPRFAARLPLPVPAPIRTGRPGGGFPWSWSIVPWLRGQTALIAPPVDLAAAAADLGRFVAALHEPASDSAPANIWRGVPLANRTSLVHEHLAHIGHAIDPGPILGLWARVLTTRRWHGPPIWIHGDLHPGNLLVDNGRLSAVIDFGDLTGGDPATDLAVAWILLPAQHRATFRASARSAADTVDDDTWMRARGWALALGLAYLANSEDDTVMASLGRTAIDAALADTM